MSHIVNVLFWVYLFTSFSLLYFETEQNKAGEILGPRGGSEWDFLYSQGLRKFLNHAKNKYGSPKFMITENGTFTFIFICSLLRNPFSLM